MNFNEIPKGGFGTTARLDVLEFQDQQFSEQADSVSQNLISNKSIIEHFQGDINFVGKSIGCTDLGQRTDFRTLKAQRLEALDLRNSLNNVETVPSATEKKIELCVKEVPGIHEDRLLEAFQKAISEIERPNSDFQKESERAQKAIENFKKSCQG